MVEEFVNGRVAFMTSSLAHINLIRQNAPNLNFAVMPVPAMDGYDGPRGLAVANWGIGIASNSRYQDEAWKFIEYMMRPEVNARLAEGGQCLPRQRAGRPGLQCGGPVVPRCV